MNLLICDVFVFYKLFSEKNLFSSLLKIYVALSFVCNFF